MNTTRLAQFRRAFRTYEWTAPQRRLYARRWVRCVRLLGSRWRAIPS